MQVDFLIRDLGTNRFTNLELTSPIAALLEAGAALARPAAWRAWLSGGGAGAWAAIAFVPFFLFAKNPATVVGWLIVVGIGAMMAALRWEGRLSGGGVVRQLVAGATVAFAAVLCLQIAVMAIALLVSPTG